MVDWGHWRGPNDPAWPILILLLTPSYMRAHKSQKSLEKASNLFSAALLLFLLNHAGDPYNEKVTMMTLLGPCWMVHRLMIALICISTGKCSAVTSRGPNYFSMGSHQNGNLGLHQDSIRNNDRVDGSGADSGHL